MSLASAVLAFCRKHSLRAVCGLAAVAVQHAALAHDYIALAGWGMAGYAVGTLLEACANFVISKSGPFYQRMDALRKVDQLSLRRGEKKKIRRRIVAALLAEGPPVLPKRPNAALTVVRSFSPRRSEPTHSLELHFARHNGRTPDTEKVLALKIENDVAAKLCEALERSKKGNRRVELFLRDEDGKLLASSSEPTEPVPAE